MAQLHTILRHQQFPDTSTSQVLTFISTVPRCLELELPCFVSIIAKAA